MTEEGEMQVTSGPQALGTGLGDPGQPLQVGFAPIGQLVMRISRKANGLHG